MNEFITVACVHGEREDALSGPEYLSRARILTKGRADQKAWETYTMEENLHLLPTVDKDGNMIEAIVFVDAPCKYADERLSVRYVLRYRDNWYKSMLWDAFSVPRHYLVAIPP